MKRVIIAGGREFEDKWFLEMCIESVLGCMCEGDTRWCPHDDYTVLSGKARGADELGEKWAKKYNITIEEHPANWDVHGRSAGPIRNENMARNADILVAFWDGLSRGTKNMIDNALKYGLELHVFRYGK